MIQTLREIPFSRPEFDDAEAKAVAEVLASGWVSQGPKVERFETLFAERVGARFGVATTSCTTPVRRVPLRLSSTYRRAIAVAPTSSAMPSASSMCC